MRSKAIAIAQIYSMLHSFAMHCGCFYDATFRGRTDQPTSLKMGKELSWKTLFLCTYSPNLFLCKYNPNLSRLPTNHSMNVHCSPSLSLICGMERWEWIVPPPQNKRSSPLTQQRPLALSRKSVEIVEMLGLRKRTDLNLSCLDTYIQSKEK